MLAAVNDVEERHWEQGGLRVYVLVELHPHGRRRGLGASHRDAEDGISSEPALVLGAIQPDHLLVDPPLLRHREPDQPARYLSFDGRDGFGDASSVEPCATVPELDGLVDARRGAAGHRRPAEVALLGGDLDLDGGVAPAIQYLPGVDVIDSVAHLLSGRNASLHEKMYLLNSLCELDQVLLLEGQPTRLISFSTDAVGEQKAPTFTISLPQGFHVFHGRERCLGAHTGRRDYLHPLACTVSSREHALDVGFHVAVHDDAATVVGADPGGGDVL